MKRIALCLSLLAAPAAAQGFTMAPAGAVICDTLEEVRTLVATKRSPPGCGRLRGRAAVLVIWARVIEAGRHRVLVLKLRDRKGLVQFSPARLLKPNGIGT